MNSVEEIKIFLVEDNPMYPFIIDAMLLDMGNFKVTSFNSGEVCVAALDDNSPSLVILDYDLGDGMNGMETFKAIQVKRPNTPVIVLSSQTKVQVATDLFALGVFDYIEKGNGVGVLNKLKNSIVKALNIVVYG